MPLDWPLVGRTAEMDLIESSLTVSGVSGTVVCGPTGVGKSRIAREALGAAADRSETRWAVGTSSARTLPLGAFEAWTTPASGDLQLVRGVIEAMTSRGAHDTVVIGVDDAHLLDDLSIFVLHQIVLRSAAKLVLTVRAGEPIPAGLPEVWTAGRFERLDLQPLSRDESVALVCVALGGPLDPDAAQRLWRMTRGNTLYLRNIVEQEAGAGRLVEQHGVWRWVGEPVVPPSLVHLIESRVGILPPAVGDVLDALAVGEPIELASLRRIVSPEAVEEADERGLIRLERVDGRVQARVAHPLYGEVRRTGAARMRLRRLRGLVAAELAAGDDPRDMHLVVRRAALTVESDLEPDPDLLVRAAQGAVWLADLPLADRLAEAAILAGAGPEASFVRAHALSWLSRGLEAEAVLTAIPGGGFTDADRARVAFLLAVNRLFALADPAGAKAVIDAAPEPATAQPGGCLDAFRTVYWAAMGVPRRALQAHDGVVQDRLPDLVGAVTAWGTVVADADAGRTADAARTAVAAYAKVERVCDAAQLRFVIADAHVGALVQSGDIAEARAVAGRFRAQAADLPGIAQLIGSAIAGRAALAAGAIEAARSSLEAVVDVLDAAGESNGFGYRYQLPLTIACAMAGATDAARAALDTLARLRHPGWRFLDHEFELARAWMAACQGAVSEAIGLALAAAGMTRANGQFAAEVVCLQAAAQFGDHTGAARLGELAGLVDGPRAAVAARFADALRTGDGGTLDAASAQFEQIGDLVAAADAAAHAAIVHRHRELRGSAYASSVRAADIAERCGVTTPAIRHARERLPLTSREREILMLIGGGMSSRAVAERLTLSVRTVEGHIYRAMAKTGTGSREELTSLLPGCRGDRMVP